MDWFSRRVLSWRLSNTLDVEFCLEALHEAIERLIRVFEQPKAERCLPDMLRTDNGPEFLGSVFT